MPEDMIGVIPSSARISPVSRASSNGQFGFLAPQRGKSGLERFIPINVPRFEANIIRSQYKGSEVSELTMP